MKIDKVEFANECDQTDCGFRFNVLKNEALYFLYCMFIFYLLSFGKVLA